MRSVCVCVCLKCLREDLIDVLCVCMCECGCMCLEKVEGKRYIFAVNN